MVDVAGTYTVTVRTTNRSKAAGHGVNTYVKRRKQKDQALELQVETVCSGGKIRTYVVKQVLLTTQIQITRGNNTITCRQSKKITAYRPPQQPAPVPAAAA